MQGSRTLSLPRSIKNKDCHLFLFLQLENKLDLRANIYVLSDQRQADAEDVGKHSTIFNPNRTEHGPPFNILSALETGAVVQLWGCGATGICLFISREHVPSLLLFP